MVLHVENSRKKSDVAYIRRRKHCICTRSCRTHLHLTPNLYQRSLSRSTLALTVDEVVPQCGNVLRNRSRDFSGKQFIGKTVDDFYRKLPESCNVIKQTISNFKDDSAARPFQNLNLQFSGSKLPRRIGTAFYAISESCDSCGHDGLPIQAESCKVL